MEQLFGCLILTVLSRAFLYTHALSGMTEFSAIVGRAEGRLAIRLGEYISKGLIESLTLSPHNVAT